MATQGRDLETADVEVDGVGCVTIALAILAPARSVWRPGERVLVVSEALTGPELVAAGIRWAEERRAS